MIIQRKQAQPGHSRRAGSCCPLLSPFGSSLWPCCQLQSTSLASWEVWEWKQAGKQGIVLPSRTSRTPRLIVCTSWSQKLKSSCLFSFLCAQCSVAQLCPTLRNPMDCSPPGSSVHGVSQERILEWIAISFSMRSSQPRDRTCVSCTWRQILYH